MKIDSQHGKHGHPEKLELKMITQAPRCLAVASVNPGNRVWPGAAQRPPHAIREDRPPRHPLRSLLEKRHIQTDVVIVVNDIDLHIKKILRFYVGYRSERLVAHSHKRQYFVGDFFLFAEDLGVQR
ncbi:MAG: hypothetical protein LBU43_09960, partial [Candidatus Accumulibacter sp.]|nr:hypothetical protein [Accumulibacter sp.]